VKFGMELDYKYTYEFFVTPMNFLYVKNTKIGTASYTDFMSDKFQTL